MSLRVMMGQGGEAPTTATVITKAEIDKVSATEQSAQTAWHVG